VGGNPPATFKYSEKWTRRGGSNRPQGFFRKDIASLGGGGKKRKYNMRIKENALERNVKKFSVREGRGKGKANANVLSQLLPRDKKGRGPGKEERELGLGTRKLNLHRIG